VHHSCGGSGLSRLLYRLLIKPLVANHCNLIDCFCILDTNQILNNGGRLKQEIKQRKEATSEKGL